MHVSQHADQRMNQRGISRRLVDFTLRHGRVEGDKHAGSGLGVPIGNPADLKVP